MNDMDLSEQTLRSAWNALQFQRREMDNLRRFSYEMEKATDEAQDRIHLAMDEILEAFKKLTGMTLYGH